MPAVKMDWRFIFYIGIVALIHTFDRYECNESNILDRRQLQHGAPVSAKGAIVNRTLHGHSEQKGYYFQSMQHSTLRKRMRRFQDYIKDIGWTSSKTTESKTVAFSNITNVNTGIVFKSSGQLLLKRFKRLCYQAHDPQRQGNCQFKPVAIFSKPRWSDTGGGDAATADTSLSNLFPANATNHLAVTSKAPLKLDSMSKTRLKSSTTSAVFSFITPFLNMQTVISTSKHTPMSTFTAQEQTRSSTLKMKLISAPLTKYSSATVVANKSSWRLLSTNLTVARTLEALLPKVTDKSIGPVIRLRKATSTKSVTNVPKVTQTLIPRYTLTFVSSKRTTPSTVLSTDALRTETRRTSLRAFSPNHMLKYSTSTAAFSPNHMLKYSTSTAASTTSVTKLNPLYRLTSESIATTGSTFTNTSRIPATTIAISSAVPSSNVSITTLSLSNYTSSPVHQVSVVNMFTHDEQLKGILSAASKISDSRISAFTFMEGLHSVTTFPTPNRATFKLTEKATSDFSPTYDSLQKLILSLTKPLSVQTKNITTGRVLKMMGTGPNIETFNFRPAADPATASTRSDSNATEKPEYSKNMSIKKESTTQINSYASPRFFESAANVAIVSTVATAVALSTAFGLIWTFTSQSTKTGLLSDSLHDIERVEKNRPEVDSPTTSDRVSPSSTSTLISNKDSNSSLTPVELYSVKGLDF